MFVMYLKPHVVLVIFYKEKTKPTILPQSKKIFIGIFLTNKIVNLYLRAPPKQINLEHVNGLEKATSTWKVLLARFQNQREILF